MSVVTNYVIICGINDRGGKELENKFHPICFNQIDGGAGGNKALEIEIWAAAVNYTRSAAITPNTILEIDWDYPDEVLLLVQEQEEARPSVWCPSGHGNNSAAAWNLLKALKG